MAVSLRQLDLGESQIISLASNDPGVVSGGNPANFRLSLAEVLNFPGGQEEWVCSVADAYFRHPGSSTNVYISTDLNQPRIDGSELTQTLVRIPPIGTGGGYYYEVKTTLPLWQPLVRENVRDIEVQFTDDQGQPIAYNAGDVFTVTLLVRRAGRR